jgi:RNA polymerase sigma-70 factor (ECF subfamily)
MTDVEAVNDVIHGHREMFEIIVRRYNSQLYRTGMAYLRDHAQTEDAMQNAYLKAFQNLHRFLGKSSFATWLTRIMINECLMILRSEKRFKTEPIEDHSVDAVHESFAAPTVDPLRDEEMKTLIEQALKKLPRAQRAVYLLREAQHLTTAETAESLGLSCENVKVCLHRARESLKAQLLHSAAGIELFAYPAVYCDPMTAAVMRAVFAAPQPALAETGD